MHFLTQCIVLGGMFITISGCTTMSSNQRPVVCTHEQELNEIHQQPKNLAVDFGVKHEQANRETTLGLFS